MDGQQPLLRLLAGRQLNARRHLLLLAAALAGGAARGQGAPTAAAAPSPFRADLVRTGLYLITGGGANVLLRFSQQGTILVGAKQDGLYRPLRSQLRRLSRLSDLPVRVLVLGNHRPAHSGNWAAFAAAGVPLLVQQRTRERLGAAPASATVIGFDSTHELNFGGVQLRLHHVGPACTDNDTVVHFSDLRVLALGDLLPDAKPMPDFEGGGSLAQWPAAIDRVLALDADLVVPAFGPALPRSALVAMRAQLAGIVARGRELLAQGADATRLAAELGAVLDLGPEGATPAVARALHADLSRPV